MTEWVLILFLYAGDFTTANNIALTNVPGFATEQECQAAGEKATTLTKRTVIDGKFVCVSKTKN